MRNRVSTVIVGIIVMMAAILIRCVTAATNHSVGGYTAWSLYSNLSLWSSSTSFAVNDSLVFSYSPDHDVIEVNKSDFATCRINSPIATYNYDNQSGQTVILLSQPGWRYFVCGRPHHCSIGLKLSVQVLDQLNNTSINLTSAQQTHPLDNGAYDGSPSSLGYSNLNAVASGRNLVQLSISILGIMSIVALPVGWHLQIGGV